MLLLSVNSRLSHCRQKLRSSSTMMRNQRNGGIGLWLLFPVPSCIVAWIVAVLTLASLQLVEGLAPPPATTRAIVSKHQQHPHSRRTSSPPLRSTTRGLSITLLLRQAATSNSPDPVTPSSSVKEGTMATAVLSWADLVGAVGSTSVGRALNDEEALRITGRGAGAHRRNTLRLFDRPEDEGLPDLVLYRDHAGWCPYCQKTMLLIEEKQIPIRIDLVNMRSYGDKPNDFLRKVPNGLLPALELSNDGRIITESQVIMELLDDLHSAENGYKPMRPSPTDGLGQACYAALARLERELFSWWCTLVFRPEGPVTAQGAEGRNPLARLLGGGSDSSGTTSNLPMSSAMRGFLDCLQQVDQELQSTKGPWFFDEHDYPTMIDFIYVSHVERMLASCAYWKGLNLRDPKWNLPGLVAWLEAFEKREPYLAFKSDYFTHVMDIPPQYGPGYDGGFPDERSQMKRSIIGRDGSWHLPLPHDDPLQPLYKGPPLPGCVLEAVGLTADPDGSYESCDRATMETACRTMAAWQLAGNGPNVAKFAARGGPNGSKNPRKSFGAPLADPYAEPDQQCLPSVDAALRVICQALVRGEASLQELAPLLRGAVPEPDTAGVVSSLAYVRDRVGVPRDLPLAAARYMRAYLNWGIDALSSS